MKVSAGFSTFSLPVTSTPQSFNISLSGIVYSLTVYWNGSIDAGWTMDIANSNSQQILAVGIPFVTGDDLLDGLDYLGIKGQMLVYTEGDPSAVPTFTDLGVTCYLLYLTNSPNG